MKNSCAAAEVAAENIGVICCRLITQRRSLAKILALVAVYAAGEPNLSRSAHHVVVGTFATASCIYVVPVVSRVA